VVQVGKQKRNKEVKMPQNETPPEVIEPTAEDMQAEVSDREIAELEERLAAQQLVEKRASSDAVAAEMDANPTPATLIGAAAKGREHLLQQMRAHSEMEAANKKSYVPPVPTERQSERTRMEMEAGARAAARHAAQQASRPIPARDPREGGPPIPVHRPNDVVPDPMARAVTGSGGPLKPFSPNV
jgi:hypothetical protein